MFTVDFRFEENQTTIEFPCNEEFLSAKFDELGVKDKLKTSQYVVGTNYAALKWLVTDFADVDELNFLAKCLDSFDKNELNIFEAVCETREPRSVVEMINITYNTYNYTLVQDMSSMESIGRTHFNTAISSDDPEAIQKLKDKLLGLEESQEKMKAINKYYKKNGTCIGCDGISDERAEKLDNAAKKNYEGRPFPTYTLTNNNQNIRSIKLRINELEKLRELDFEPVEFETGKVIVNKEINRIQFFFDGKPDEETRGVLKSWGFHFSRYNNNAWQRQLNSNGIYAAKKVLEKLDEINQSEEQDIDEGPTLGM